MKRLPLALLVLAAVPVLSARGQVIVTVNQLYDAADFDLTDGIIDASKAIPGQQITLRAAIQNALLLGGNWRILMPSGVFPLTVPGNGEDQAAAGDLDLNNGVQIEIRGVPLPGPATIIDGGALGDRAFHVLGTSNVILRYLTIRNCSSVRGGAVRQDNGTLLLDTCAVSACQALGAAGAHGGGLYSAGTLTLTGTSITGNNSDGNGGGIYYEGPSLAMTDSLVDSNISGGRGGGMDIASTGSIVSLLRCSVAANRSGAGVGGGPAGGIGNRGTLLLTSSTIGRNQTSAGASGGGLENRGSATLYDSAVSTNTASLGAGILTTGSGNTHLNRSTVSSNLAEIGGGIYNAGITEVRESTINNNTAIGVPPFMGGGGIYSFATLYLVNSTISSNLCPAGYGGGLFNSSAGLSQISNCTFHDNHSTGGDSVLNGDSGGPALLMTRNTIYSNYPPVPGSSNYLSLSPAVVLSDGYNLNTDATFPLFAVGDILPPVAATIDPFLGPLQLNGGPTPTHRLFFKSIAIGAANPLGCVDHAGAILLTDQRFFARPNVSVADIGAYEARCDADLYPPPSGDGYVDDFDFVVFAGAYNILLTSDGDFDGDGDTDDDDFVAFAAAYDLLICK